MPKTGNGPRSGKATTVARRLTPQGLDLLPEEMRGPVEAALAKGSTEAWVHAPEDGRLWVEVRNVPTR
jgi:hypothetical protein